MGCVIGESSSVHPEMEREVKTAAHVTTQSRRKRPTIKRRAHPYYSFNKILSCNAIFNFVVGGRGLGKTYGAQKTFIRKAIKTGEQFMYVRRYDEELKISKKTFFAAVESEFPDWDFRVNGAEAQCTPHLEQYPDETESEFNARRKSRTWDTIGFFQALSMGQKSKSTAFPDVTTIIFDEFIIETGTQSRYLKDELTSFLNLYSTVDRNQDKTRVIFLANSVSIMNPYFIGWEIDPQKIGEFGTLRGGDIAAHFPEGKAFASSVYQTRFGKFIAGTEYARYAIGNEFRDAGETLIAQKTRNAKYQYTLETERGVFSVWRDFDEDMCYILDRRIGNERYYTIVPSLMATGKQVVSFSDVQLAMLRRDFNEGYVMFDKPATRNAFMPVFERR